MKTLFGAALAAICFFSTPSEAQDHAPRFGTGMHVLASTVDGLGLGLTGRISVPLNADVSVAIGSGFTGFLFGGTEDATWLFTPQVSGIVTLPGLYRAPYLLAGVGGYLPLGDPGRDRAGPMVHFGLGRVTLLAQSTLFYEVDPMLVLSPDRVDFAIPIRVGVIF